MYLKNEINYSQAEEIIEQLFLSSFSFLRRRRVTSGLLSVSLDACTWKRCIVSADTISDAVAQVLLTWYVALLLSSSTVWKKTAEMV